MRIFIEGVQPCLLYSTPAYLEVHRDATLYNFSQHATLPVKIRESKSIPTSSSCEETRSPSRSSRCFQDRIKIAPVFMIEETVHIPSSSFETTRRQRDGHFTDQNIVKKTLTSVAAITSLQQISVNHSQKSFCRYRLCFKKNIKPKKARRTFAGQTQAFS